MLSPYSRRVNSVRGTHTRTRQQPCSYKHEGKSNLWTTGQEAERNHTSYVRTTRRIAWHDMTCVGLFPRAAACPTRALAPPFCRTEDPLRFALMELWFLVRAFARPPPADKFVPSTRCNLRWSCGTCGLHTGCETMTRAKHAPAVSPTLPTIRMAHRQENMKCHDCSARGLAVALVGARTLEDLEDHLRVAVDAPPSPVGRSSRSERLHTTSRHVRTYVSTYANSRLPVLSKTPP